MNDRIREPAPQAPFATNAPSGNTPLPAALIGTATDGVVDDLGNLIQIQRSTESIVSSDPAAMATDDPNPTNTHANASLEQAGLLPDTPERDALQGAA